MSDPAEPPGYAIGAAAPSDAAAIAEFNLRLAAETEDLRLDPATVRAGVAALLADPAKGRYFVARATAGQDAGGPGGSPNPQMSGASPPPVVGQLMITWEWSDWRNGEFWWIQSVYVHPAHRGRGVFRELLRHVRALAKEAGAVGLRLYVEHANASAITTYERSGFSCSGYRVFGYETGGERPSASPPAGVSGSED